MNENNQSIFLFKTKSTMKMLAIDNIMSLECNAKVFNYTVIFCGN